MAIETGRAFVVIHVDLESPNAAPSVEIVGMSTWAAQNLLHTTAQFLYEELPDFILTQVTRRGDVGVCREPFLDGEDEEGEDEEPVDETATVTVVPE